MIVVFAHHEILLAADAGAVALAGATASQFWRRWYRLRARLRRGAAPDPSRQLDAG